MSCARNEWKRRGVSRCRECSSMPYLIWETRLHVWDRSRVSGSAATLLMQLVQVEHLLLQVIALRHHLEPVEPCPVGISQRVCVYARCLRQRGKPPERPTAPAGSGFR